MYSISNNPYVGKSGDLGTDYEIQWSRFQKRKRVFGYEDFKSNLFMSGTDGDAVLQRIENHIEGHDSNGNGVEGDLLSWDKYLESNDKKNDILFQAEDNVTFTNVDFNNNHYEVMDEKGFTEKLGMSWENDKPYDVYEIGSNQINFYEFQFAGEGDGNQANVAFDLSGTENARWGLQNFVMREVDTTYWNKAVDTKNKESILSHDSLRIIKSSIPQWMTDQIEQTLSAYKKDSVEYWTKFYAIAIDLMDQTNEYKGIYK